MIKAANTVLAQIFQDNLRYAKAGVMLCELCRQEQITHDLFDPIDSSVTAKSEQLMTVMDSINRQLSQRAGQGGEVVYCQSRDWEAAKLANESGIFKSVLYHSFVGFGGGEVSGAGFR